MLKPAKQGKQPGPDNIVMELYKWLDVSSRSCLLKILNSWWSNSCVPSEVVHARVVPIYKKGKIDEAANNRLISLLNNIYKVYAALIRNRMQVAVDSKSRRPNTGADPIP